MKLVFYRAVVSLPGDSLSLRTGAREEGEGTLVSLLKCSAVPDTRTIDQMLLYLYQQPADFSIYLCFVCRHLHHGRRLNESCFVALDR
jgi:hypothetical protein